MIPSVGTPHANLFDLATTGARRAMNQATQAGQRLADGDIDPEPMVQLMEAKVGLKANLAVLRTADEMLGTLLDEKA
jgi:hypothetical protein